MKFQFTSILRARFHGLWIAVAISLVVVTGRMVWAQPEQQATADRTLPVFVDGEAQVVPGFRNRNDWIRHDLFVETEFRRAQSPCDL